VEGPLSSQVLFADDAVSPNYGWIIFFDQCRRAREKHFFLHSPIIHKNRTDEQLGALSFISWYRGTEFKKKSFFFVPKHVFHVSSASLSMRHFTVLSESKRFDKLSGFCQQAQYSQQSTSTIFAAVNKHNICSSQQAQYSQQSTSTIFAAVNKHNIRSSQQAQYSQQSTSMVSEVSLRSCELSLLWK
jgi:hypothetical protein